MVVSSRPFAELDVGKEQRQREGRLRLDRVQEHVVMITMRSFAHAHLRVSVRSIRKCFYSVLRSMLEK